MPGLTGSAAPSANLPTVAILTCQYNTGAITATSGNYYSCFVDGNGNVKVAVAAPLPIGANVIGKVGIDQSSPGTSNAVQVAAGSGANQILANAVAATPNQMFTSTTFGYPKTLTLCMSASAATTFTVTEAVNTTFYSAALANGTTTANYIPTGAGTRCESITPAAFVKVATSAANTVTIEAQATY